MRLKSLMNMVTQYFELVVQLSYQSCSTGNYQSHSNRKKYVKKFLIEKICIDVEFHVFGNHLTSSVSSVITLSEEAAVVWAEAAVVCAGAAGFSATTSCVEEATPSARTPWLVETESVVGFAVSLAGVFSAGTTMGEEVC